MENFNYEQLAKRARSQGFRITESIINVCGACNEIETARCFIVGDRTVVMSLCTPCLDIIQREASSCSNCNENTTQDICYAPKGVSGSDWTMGIDLCVNCIIVSESHSMQCVSCLSQQAQWHVSDASRVPRIMCDSCWKPYHQ